MSFLNKVKEMVVGQTKEQVENETQSPPKPIKTILITSALIALGTILPILPRDIPTYQELYNVGVVFISAFVTQLLIEYGLKKKISE